MNHASVEGMSICCDDPCRQAILTTPIDPRESITKHVREKFEILSTEVFAGRMRIATMEMQAFRAVLVNKFADDFKQSLESMNRALATPPKNKPYYRQFEKRGKW